MPLYTKLPNYDKWFEEVTAENRVLVVNDIADDIAYGRADIPSMIQQTIKSETIDIIPSCECGFYKATFYKGIKCPKCETVVKPVNLDTVPSIWYRRLDGEPMFLNPGIWDMLNSVISTKYDAMKFLSNANYNPEKIAPVLYAVINNIPDYKRNYSFFISHLDEIMQIIYKHNFVYKNKKKRMKMENIFAIMDMYKDNLFSEYLPAIPRGAMLRENVAGGRKYLTFVAPKQVEAIVKFANACISERPIVKSRAMSTLISDNVLAVNTFLSTLGGGKKGYFRSDMLRSRLGNTARAVIGAMSGKHDIDTIYLPWGLSVSLFMPHLINILRNEFGFKYRDAMDLIIKNIYKYNETISKALDRLLELAEYNIPAILQRNPSLMRGSAIKFRIPHIKRDPNDFTISVPPAIVTVLRGDFDGDELNLTLLIDEYLSNLMDAFKLSNNVMDENNPYKISERINLTNPGNLTLGSALPNKG